jgi:hypothetical protein
MTPKTHTHPMKVCVSLKTYIFWTEFISSFLWFQYPFFKQFESKHHLVSTTNSFHIDNSFCKLPILSHQDVPEFLSSILFALKTQYCGEKHTLSYKRPLLFSAILSVLLIFYFGFCFPIRKYSTLLLIKIWVYGNREKKRLKVEDSFYPHFPVCIVYAN